MIFQYNFRNLAQKGNNFNRNQKIVVKYYGSNFSNQFSL